MARRPLFPSASDFFYWPSFIGRAREERSGSMGGEDLLNRLNEVRRMERLGEEEVVGAIFDFGAAFIFQHSAGHDDFQVRSEDFELSQFSDVLTHTEGAINDSQRNRLCLGLAHQEGLFHGRGGGCPMAMHGQQGDD